MKSNPIIIKKGLGPAGPGRGSRVVIPGVSPSTSRFGEQVVKLRVSSLDAYIGGGIPIGSICLIRDEFPSKFGDMVLKSFIADGATYNHRLYIASCKVNPETFSKEMPSLRKSSDGSGSGKTLDDDDQSTDLKIAWRYGHSQQPGGGIPVKNSEQNMQSFDFSKKSSVEDLGGKNLHLSKCCDDSNTASLRSCSGDDIIQEIIPVVDGLDLEGQTKPPNNVARIAISYCEEQVLSNNFMFKLRAILQHTNSCAVITLADAACRDSFAVARAEHLSDIVISLQTITDDKRRNELGGIDGVCNIKKVASNYSLKIFEPPKDIGFSFKKRRLLFHELNLPPEGETTTQREGSTRSSSGIVSSSGSCGTTIKGKSIDF